MPTLVSMTDLPLAVTPRGPAPGRYLLEGAKVGLEHLTLILGETAPGRSGVTHRHDYEELFIIHGGRGTYYVGDDVVKADPGDVVLIPPVCHTDSLTSARRRSIIQRSTRQVAWPQR